VIVDANGVDEAATAARRAARQDRPPRGGMSHRPSDPRGGERPAGAPTEALFDFGPARREHERRWPPDLQDLFIALLMSVPAPYRAYVRRTLYPRVNALAEHRAVDPGDLERLWQELRGAIRFR
jgi:hypothetical protein